MGDSDSQARESQVGPAGTGSGPPPHVTGSFDPLFHKNLKKTHCNELAAACLFL